MVLCIMHIYAHILAAEDDEAGRVVQIARTVFMQMPAHSCCTLRHFPSADLPPTQQIDFVSNLSLSLSVSLEGRREGEKSRESRWKGKMARPRKEEEIRTECFICKRFIFEYSLKGESALRKLGNGKESAGLNKTTPLKPSLLGRRGGTISISRPLPVETFHIQFVPLVSR